MLTCGTKSITQAVRLAHSLHTLHCERADDVLRRPPREAPASRAPKGTRAYQPPTARSAERARRRRPRSAERSTGHPLRCNAAEQPRTQPLGRPTTRQPRETSSQRVARARSPRKASYLALEADGLRITPRILTCCSACLCRSITFFSAESRGLSDGLPESRHQDASNGTLGVPGFIYFTGPYCPARFGSRLCRRTGGGGVLPPRPVPVGERERPGVRV